MNNNNKNYYYYYSFSSSSSSSSYYYYAHNIHHAIMGNFRASVETFLEISGLQASY